MGNSSKGASADGAGGRGSSSTTRASGGDESPRRHKHKKSKKDRKNSKNRSSGSKEHRDESRRSKYKKQSKRSKCSDSSESESTPRSRSTSASPAPKRRKSRKDSSVHRGEKAPQEAGRQTFTLGSMPPIVEGSKESFISQAPGGGNQPPPNQTQCPHCEQLGNQLLTCRGCTDSKQEVPGVLCVECVMSEPGAQPSSIENTFICRQCVCIEATSQRSNIKNLVGQCTATGAAVTTLMFTQHECLVRLKSYSAKQLYDGYRIVKRPPTNKTEELSLKEAIGLSQAVVGIEFLNAQGGNSTAAALAVESACNKGSSGKHPHIYWKQVIKNSTPTGVLGYLMNLHSSLKAEAQKPKASKELAVAADLAEERRILLQALIKDHEISTLAEHRKSKQILKSPDELLEFFYFLLKRPAKKFKPRSHANASVLESLLYDREILITRVCALGHTMHNMIKLVKGGGFYSKGARVVNVAKEEARNFLTEVWEDFMARRPDAEVVWNKIQSNYAEHQFGDFLLRKKACRNCFLSFSRSPELVSSHTTSGCQFFVQGPCFMVCPRCKPLKHWVSCCPFIDEQAQRQRFAGTPANSDSDGAVQHYTGYGKHRQQHAAESDHGRLRESASGYQPPDTKSGKFGSRQQWQQSRSAGSKLGPVQLPHGGSTSPLQRTPQGWKGREKGKPTKGSRKGEFADSYVEPNDPQRGGRTVFQKSVEKNAPPAQNRGPPSSGGGKGKKRGEKGSK